MGHLPPDRLVAASLTPEEEEHIAGCPDCRNERRLAQFHRRGHAYDPHPPAPSSNGYTLEHVLGRSAAAVVYAARPHRGGEWYAIKVVAGSPEEAELRRDRLRRYCGIVDPRIVRFDDFIAVGPDQGLVAPLVDGAPLAALFVVHTFSAEEGAALLFRILDAVRVLHGLSLAHGALRANNILLDPDAEDLIVRLTDVGLTEATPRDDVEALARLAQQIADRCSESPEWVAPFLQACDSAVAADQVRAPQPGPLAGVASVCRDLRDRWAVIMDAEPNRYRRHRLIGSGGNGVVYRAWDSAYACDVAIKMLAPLSARSNDLAAEYRRLDTVHPNLVTMYDRVGSPVRFIVMEYIDGEQLDAAKHSSLVDSIAVQLFDGLAALHGQNVFHRDVKLGNLLLERGGRLVLVDFGLSLEVHAGAALPEGSAGYIAPEVHKLRPPTPAVDVYAAGIILFELCRGAPWLKDEPPSEAEVRAACRAPALADLIVACVHPDPDRRPKAMEARDRLPTPAQAPWLLPRLEGPFVGRSREVHRLRDGLGSGAVLRIVGPPGIGKTRLVREVLQGHALTGRCSPNEAVAFNAFERPLSELGVEPLGPEATDAATSTTVRQFLDRWGEVGTPLWIDDAQWMDADSQRFLRAVLRAGSHPPLLLTHRPLDALAPVTETLRPIDSMNLGPLSDAAVTDLGFELQLEASEAAIRRCGGNPLLLTRLALRGPDYETDLLGRVPLSPADRASAREVLALVALHEGPIPTPLVAMVAKVGRFAQVLTTLIRSRILAYATTRSIDFAHDSERELVLADLPAETRAARHEALAVGFEWPAHRDAGALAVHWSAAGQVHRAFAPALEAAEAAERSGAWARAARFYGIALRAGRDAALTRRRADALANAGYNEEAGRLLGDAESVVDQTRAAELLCASANLPEADRVVDRALHKLRLPRSRSPLLDLAIGIATSIRLEPPPLASVRNPDLYATADLLWALTGSLGQFDPIRTFRYVPLHVRTSFRTGDPTRAARAFASLLVYVDGKGASAARLRELDAQLDALVEHANPDVRGWVEASRGYRLLMRGELHAAERHFDAADDHYRPTGIVRWEWTLTQTHRVLTSIMRGQYSEARARYEPLIARHRDLGDRATESLLLAGAGVTLALVDDDPDEAERRLGRSRALLPHPAFAFQSLQLVGEVLLHLYRAEPDRARGALARARATMPLTWLFRVPRAQVLFLEGLCAAPDLGRLRRRLRALRKIQLPFAELRAETLALIEARLAGRDVETAARQCREITHTLGAADHADAAALFLEPRQVVLARAQARGVRAPERWLGIFGGSA